MLQIGVGQLEVALHQVQEIGLDRPLVLSRGWGDLGGEDPGTAGLSGRPYRSNRSSARSTACTVSTARTTIDRKGLVHGAASPTRWAASRATGRRSSSLRLNLAIGPP